MLASIAGVAHAQDVAKKLTLDRVFGEPSLAGPSLRGLKLSPDGTLVTLLKARPDEQERYDLWAIDTATGAQRMLVDRSEEHTSELQSLMRISYAVFCLK